MQPGDADQNMASTLPDPFDRALLILAAAAAASVAIAFATGNSLEIFALVSVIVMFTTGLAILFAQRFPYSRWWGRLGQPVALLLAIVLIWQWDLAFGLALVVGMFSVATVFLVAVATSLAGRRP